MVVGWLVGGLDGGVVGGLVGWWVGRWVGWWVGALVVWCECLFRGPTHRGGKSGCELVTEFGGYSYDGVSAGIWFIHRGPKSGGEQVTLFGGYSYDGGGLV